MSHPLPAHRRPTRSEPWSQELGALGVQKKPWARKGGSCFTWGKRLQELLVLILSTLEPRESYIESEALERAANHLYSYGHCLQKSL